VTKTKTVDKKHWSYQHWCFPRIQCIQSETKVYKNIIILTSNIENIKEGGTKLIADTVYVCRDYYLCNIFPNTLSHTALKKFLARNRHRLDNSNVW